MLVELYKRSTTLYQRFVDAINELFAKLKKIVSAVNENAKLMQGGMDQLQKLWDKCYAEASETIKNTALEKSGEVEYSIAPSLKEDLQSVFDNKFDSESNEVLIGSTSDFLVNEIGAKPLPNYMPANKAYSAMATEEKASKDGKPVGDDYNYHGLGVEGLHELLEKAETPVAAYVSEPSETDGRFDRLVLVTDKVIGEGYGVVIVEVDSKSRSGKKQIEANKTITSFDKRSAILAVQKAFDENRLLFINKKSGTVFDPGRKGTICPTTISETVRKNNIQQFWANVNWAKYAKNTKSRIFTSGDTSGTTMADAFKKAGYTQASLALDDSSYLSIAERYRDGTATEAETEQLRQAVEQAARKAMPNTKTGLCRCERKTRNALYTPQRLGRSHTMGQA